jgi:hypothetical protein
MITLKQTLAGLALVAGIVGLASPGFAHTRPDRSDARERAAIHVCSISARKQFPHEDEEETLNYFAYRSCMGEYGFFNE